MSDGEAQARMAELLGTMARLRDPEGGCPWDREQDFASIVPHTLEEAYEVAEAIERGDLDALRDELGDLLFQVVFYARLAEEASRFDFADVAAAIDAKLRRRHPHVFGNAEVAGAAAQSAAWEAHKRREREAAGAGSATLAGVGANLPALTRAAKLQRRAAAAGFEWPARAPARAKLLEELGELDEAAASGSAAAMLAESGDLLFACVSLLRQAGVDPEQALRAANRKFERRFAAVEARLAAEGRRPEDCPLQTLTGLWDAVKAGEGDPAS